MSDELTRFFNKINLTDYDAKAYENVSILKVVVLSKTSSFKVYLSFPDLISYKELKKLDEASKNGLSEKALKIDYSYENISDEAKKSFFLEVLEELKNEKPSLASLEEKNIKFEDNIIEASSAFEKELFEDVCKKIKKAFKKFDALDYSFTVEINEEENQKIKKAIKEEKKATPTSEKKEEKKGLSIKSPDKYQDTTINNIMGETKNVVVEAYIFGVDTLERDNINIITLKISDKTNSLIAKVFKKKKEEYFETLGLLKTGNWYKFYGNIEYDNFSKDLILSIRDFEAVDKEDEQVKDDALTPRVELHLHTMMSAMDSVVPVDDVVKYAISMGHKAIAVTDHNGCQAFPNLFHAVESYNKGKEKEDHFKV